MLFDHLRPHVFRVQCVAPGEMIQALKQTMDALKKRKARTPALEAFALHRAHTDRRIILVEAWRDRLAFARDADGIDPNAVLYEWAATGGRDPTPVEDPAAGAIIIDTFAIWRPLLRPVSRFNIRNGEAFNRAPGCISTTVLRGVSAGSIATYARWRNVEDFVAAFSVAMGKTASTPDDVNRIAARATFGLIRPDYHSYELVMALERADASI